MVLLFLLLQAATGVSTRWLAFAVASWQLVAIARYNNERCVRVSLQVGVLEADAIVCGVFVMMHAGSAKTTNAAQHTAPEDSSYTWASARRPPLRVGYCALSSQKLTKKAVHGRRAAKKQRASSLIVCRITGAQQFAHQLCNGAKKAR
jgi:ribosomal protein L32